MSAAPEQGSTLTGVDYDPFAGAAIAQVAPTTEPQREVWLASRLGREASLAYNESVSIRFRGPLNIGALCEALRGFVGRHEALRATLSESGEELYIADDVQLEVPVLEASLQEKSVVSWEESFILAARRRAVETAFDLELGPLFCAEILVISSADHVLVVTAHHIVFDGWSAGIMMQDLAALYRANLTSSAPLIASAVAFSSYALAQRDAAGGETQRDAVTYWMSQFSSQTPSLDLPTDAPRSAFRTFASRREDIVLPAELVAEVRKVGAKSGASLFVTLLGAFGALLHRLTGVPEIVVGVPAAGQSVGGQQNLVGQCVNLLPIKFAFDPSMTMAAVLSASRVAMLDGYEHQEFTFSSLLKKLSIERDPSRLPLVSVMFNLDQAIDTVAEGFQGLDVDFSINPRSYENFELSINAVQTKGGIRLECQYNTDLFDAKTIHQWMSCYEILLNEMVQNVDSRLDDIALLDGSGTRQLAAWNDTDQPFSQSLQVHDLIDAQIERAGARTAIRWGDTSLSYSALDVRARLIESLLRAKGVTHSQLVGLYVNRGTDMVAAMLAILRVGAGYVPLDPSYPADRLAFMIEDAELSALITEQSLVLPSGFPKARCVYLDSPDTLHGVVETHEAVPLQRASPSDVAYVIYTSGSTGKPKGVRVPHRAVVNFLESMAREPGLTENDRIVAVTTLSFDIAVNELLLPLSVGAEIVLASTEEASDGLALVRLIAATHATTMQATPSTWRMLLDAGWSGHATFKALCGGEALTKDLAEQLLAKTGSLWNMYGPTETTVWSTCCRVSGIRNGISIGRPIANTSVWILDERQQRCPIGVPGEIWIGGAGVTLGYLKRPELTLERFIDDPFSTVASARLYRTGDRGRWRTDGVLEHMGRLDFQVKVRGYRIELGEIESNLLAYESIARSLVIAREDRPGDVRLVAYVVPKSGVTIHEDKLKAHVRQSLPDYMVPQHVVSLVRLPLLPNGKIDRKALPAPLLSVTSRGEFAAAESELEKTVISVMESLLSLPSLSVNDSFFGLGGHSLLASQLASQLSKKTNIQIPMRAIFEAPTGRKLAQWIEKEKKSGAKSVVVIPRRENRDVAPLSAMQQRIWFLEELDPGKTFHNTPSAHRLTGALDELAFERAFAEMVRRQDVLRTIIEITDGSAIQVILPHVTTPLLPVEDLRHVPSESREAQLQAKLASLIDVPFVLNEAPLFRVKLFRLNEEEYVLFFMVHHIIWDGWSFDVMYEDLHALYESFRHGLPSPLAELAVTYGDFSAWQQEWMRGPEMATEVAYWKEHFVGEIEPLATPADFPRPAIMSGNGKMTWCAIPGDLINEARELGRSVDATLYMTLLTAYAALLHQLTAQSEIVVGTPVRGRQVVELESVLGFFVNAIPLRIRAEGQQTFISLLEHVRDCVLGGLEHPDVPIEQLVRVLNVPRDRSRSPIFQAMFSYQDARRRNTRWGNMERARLEVMQPGVTVDLSMWMVELPHELFFGLSYNTDILSDESAEILRERFVDLLRHSLRNSCLLMSQIPVALAEAARLADWNASTAAEFDRVALIQSAFEQVALKSPTSIAIRFQDLHITYGELNVRANKLARAIQARGVRSGALVGLFVERSIDMIVALLAILKSGAAYVPLDPAYPEARLKFMVEDAQLALLVTNTGLLSQCPMSLEKVILLDTDQAMLAALPGSSPAHSASPENVAYVIYTSGSTGKPKGVQVPHRAVVNFLTSMAREPGLSVSDRLVAVTTLSFDIAVLELLLPLTVGAQVVLAGREDALDGRALANLISTNGATVMQATPGMWHMLLEGGWQAPAGFKGLVGGEALPPDLASRLIQVGVELWNMYGPTETTVWSTCWRVKNAEMGIKIGLPIANTHIHILDNVRQPCPIGVAGEIWIGGDGVSLGYLNRPALTAERFIDDPHTTKSGGKLYGTGDRGRWRSDGLLEHLGRLDFQVKVRGYRIELGEIEACIASHSSVVEVLVMTREDVPSDVRIVAYFTARNEQLEHAVLRDHLRALLPAYMLPQHYVQLAEMPRLPNGKMDRAALPRPSTLEQSSAVVTRVEPSTDTEIMLAEIWCDLLKVPAVYADDNFFDLGGHSLLGMEAVLKMETKVSKRINPGRYIFETLGQIARAYDDTESMAPTKRGKLSRLFSSLTGSK
jgi:amino acid adenylation domain-containing protein